MSQKICPVLAATIKFILDTAEDRVVVVGSYYFSVANHPILAHMVTRHLIPEDIAADYEVHEWRNATGVLQTAHLNERQDIIAALRAFQFRRSDTERRRGQEYHRSADR